MRTLIRIAVGGVVGTVAGVAAMVATYAVRGAFGVRSPEGDARLGWGLLQLFIPFPAPIFALIGAAARRPWVGGVWGAAFGAFIGVLALLDVGLVLTAHPEARPAGVIVEHMAHASAAAVCWAVAGGAGGAVAKLIDGGRAWMRVPPGRA
jgi:hypothetical protein